MTDNVLTALLGGQVVGEVQRRRGGRLTFTYDSTWRRWRKAFPLSLSMPLAAAKHDHDRIEAFLWNLLPDNQHVLDAWGRRFQVSPRNAFSLIAEVGEDCAGAVQFARPERIDDLLQPGPPVIDWLDEAAVGARLAALRRDRSAWLPPGNTGQFSLAGAQPKFALAFDGARWGVPQGRTPTTHILKPPAGEFDGLVENEHLCLSLARAAGLPAAHSQVMQFNGEVAIVIERFDRVRLPGNLVLTSQADAVTDSHVVARLHQEDLCQAFGLPPTSKYQNEGGPSPESVVELLRTHSSRAEQDVPTFIDALAFNWLVAGTDGHSKNYSLLHGGGGQLRLAPLYDVASALPYPDLDPYRIRLAMKIGGKYRLRDIRVAEWAKLARNVGQDEHTVLQRIASLAGSLLEAIEPVFDEAIATGLDAPVTDRLRSAVTTRATKSLRLLRQ
jgi:serine/threonine-protein kinase HipA